MNLPRALWTIALLLTLAPLAPAATVKISDLTIITAPSTNTFIEVADMDAVTKSRKYLLTNLVTKAELAANVANPTATIGLTAVNGTATTAMRSDAAPALSSVGTPGTYTSVTTDAAGRVTAGSNPAVTSAANWTAEGTTNSTLAGVARANSGVFTNGITAGASTFTGNLTLGDSSAATYTLSSALSGATDPVLTFQNGAIANSSPYYAPTGTAGAPSYSFTTGTTAGLRYDGSSAVIGVASGADIFSWSASTIRMRDNGTYTFSSSSAPTGGADVIIGRDAANTVQFGSDSATATAQTLKGPDGSGTDKVGGALQLGGGKSTGTAAGGAVILHTANSAGASGSSLNSNSERFHAIPKWVTLTSATATTLFTLPVPATNYVGLTATVTIYATDGTDHQSKTSVITVDAIAKTTTITPTISQVDNTTAASAGTLTCTYTAVDNTSNVLAVKATADSSLTETVLRAKIVITAINSNGSGAVTEF